MLGHHYYKDPTHLSSLFVGFERGGISQNGNLKVFHHKVFLLFGWMWSVGAAIGRCDIDGWSIEDCPFHLVGPLHHYCLDDVHRSLLSERNYYRTI